MHCCTFFVFLFCAVALAQNSNKSKYDDGRIWGYVEETKIENWNNDNHREDKVNITEYDPCKFYDPEKPSFKAPGRRISEEACEDYLWDVQLNEERSKRKEDCLRLKFFPQPPPRPVGGRPAFSGEFPHMGALGWKSVNPGYVFKCGSTLISSKFVLTAAHCSSAPIDDVIIDSTPKIVRLNDINLFPEKSQAFEWFSFDSDIIRIVNHPSYRAPKKYYDIALVELKKVVSFTDSMRPACLWTNKDHKLGTHATLTGWGVMKFRSLELSPDLQAADVDIIAPEQCDRLLLSSRNRHFQGLMEHQLCAGKLSGGVDACQGDSGGPLQIAKYKLKPSERPVLHNVIGVTSFGIGCGFPNLPGIYTRVSSFIDWIEPIVWSNSTV